MPRMRFGQSAADADTLTRACPLATSTESVSCHTEENLGVDQWYKSMSRSPPATAMHVRENFLATRPQTPPASKLNGANSTSEAEASRLRLIALAHEASFFLCYYSLRSTVFAYATYPADGELKGFKKILASTTYCLPEWGWVQTTPGTRLDLCKLHLLPLAYNSTCTYPLYVPRYLGTVPGSIAWI
jgi:hypothetical protein